MHDIDVLGFSLNAMVSSLHMSGEISTETAVAAVSALIDWCHDHAFVIGKGFEVRSFSSLATVSCSHRLFESIDKNRRLGQFFLSPSSTPLQEFCSP